MTAKKRRAGWIEVVCGCMFCGKTIELIRLIHRVKVAKQRFQVFKHYKDSRYDPRNVSSHIGLQVEAVPVRNVPELERLIQPRTRVVFIDEAQFFGKTAFVALCQKLIDRGVRVVVAGLDMDFRGQGFGPMPELLARAKSVTKLSAVCEICGADDANQSQRLVNKAPAAYNDQIVLVAGSDAYQARCKDCYRRPIEKKHRRGL